MRHTSIAEEIHYARTSDGWDIALHHYTPKTEITQRKHPVVLCHGIGGNRFNWDMPNGVSLARTLAKEGYDVWIPELRGNGFSKIPSGHTRDEITFDHYVFEDVPAVVHEVGLKSLDGKIHWIGHSMGGMVMYGYLGRLRDERIHSFVAVGSPPYFKNDIRSSQHVYTWITKTHGWFGWFPSKTLSLWGSPWAHTQLHASVHTLWNPDNMHPAHAKQAALWLVEDIPFHVALQVASAGPLPGRLAPLHGLFDYTQSIAHINTPTLLVAGMLDHLAPPYVMADAYALLSSADKTLYIIAKANGASADYGHVDLALGKHAEEDVFKPLIIWLNAHD